MFIVSLFFSVRNSIANNYFFYQIALTLAIAEQQMQFEHRDLHWGNILLEPTDQPFVSFKLKGRAIDVPSNGVKATIIDYSLSRMLYNRRVSYIFFVFFLCFCLIFNIFFYNKQILHNDLSNDKELFSANGDYQFLIYRLMRTRLNDDWSRFNPYTNVLWLHYVVDKLICGARYQSTKTRMHSNAYDKLMSIRDAFLEYKSALDLAEVVFCN